MIATLTFILQIGIELLGLLAMLGVATLIVFGFRYWITMLIKETRKHSFDPDKELRKMDRKATSK